MRFHGRFERGEIHGAASRRMMVVSLGLHIVDVKTSKPVSISLEMLGVMDEAEVLFDLRVTRVVPIGQGRAFEFAEQEGEVIFKGHFLYGLAIFAAELDATRFCFGRDLAE